MHFILKSLDFSFEDIVFIKEIVHLLSEVVEFA